MALLVHSLKSVEVAFYEGYVSGIQKSRIKNLFPPTCIVAYVAGKNPFYSEFKHASVRIEEMAFEYLCQNSSPLNNCV